MAYAAVISLKQILLPLIVSPHISLESSSEEIVQRACFAAVILQEALEKLDRSGGSSRWRISRGSVNDLDGRIREFVSRFDELLESRISDQIDVDLKDLRQDVDSFAETAVEMAEEYVSELEKPFSDDEDEEEEGDGGGCGERKGKMVGFSYHFNQIKDCLITWNLGSLTSLVGMAGIGKTTLARESYRDELVSNHFEGRAWVRVGRRYWLDRVARLVLAQLDHDREGEVEQHLKVVFESNKCLVVLDDVWDTDVKDYFKNLVREEDNGTRILITTRLHEVAEGDTLVRMKLLDKEVSWELLYQKVFVEGGHPFHFQLEKAGKKIAEKCDGLPLMIVTVADALLKAEISPEYWEKVAEKKNSVFNDAYDEISKVLLPSYLHLPNYLKPCFLSLGVFPENEKISRSNIINLWIAEGFIEPNTTQTLEDRANECLEAIFANCLIVTIHQRSTGKFGSVKTCRLHSCFWHMCRKVAAESKFYHVLISLDDAFGEGMSRQSRLCVHNNILLGIDGVNDFMIENCKFSAHSLLCFGPYHPYPVPICFGLRSVRVLDALKIRFYEFPVEVSKLERLRYLSFICNGEISKSISKLRGLQFLVICEHMSVKYIGVSYFLPTEIWDMQELKYVRIIGRDLPSPNCGPSLDNLLTLLGVSHHTCTKEVFEKTPNLNKLGIEVKLEPNSNDVAPLTCFDHISNLKKLRSFKCVVVNPDLRFEIVAPQGFGSMFPSSLQKLHLSGLGCPWECMTAIGSLPNLRVLKLRSYAFRGPRWVIQSDAFQILQVLVIEDTDLVQWVVEDGGLPYMVLLTIKDCYKLKEINWDPDYNLEKIEVEDCSPSAVSWVNQIKSRRDDPFFNSYVHSSWKERKTKA